MYVFAQTKLNMVSLLNMETRCSSSPYACIMCMHADYACMHEYMHACVICMHAYHACTHIMHVCKLCMHAYDACMHNMHARIILKPLINCGSIEDSGGLKGRRLRGRPHCIGGLMEPPNALLIPAAPRSIMGVSSGIASSAAHGVGTSISFLASIIGAIGGSSAGSTLSVTKFSFSKCSSPLRSRCI